MSTTSHKEWNERSACLGLDPSSFHVRHPPAAEELYSFTTEEDELFQTIHMGAAIVDEGCWQLVIEGLVENPTSLSLEQLKAMPSTNITSFHECYGPPTAPPEKNYFRIGNVVWTGVRLEDILKLAVPKSEARYVWSDGLDYGKFAGRTSDRYQKDLPIEKAMTPEVLVAYEMNHQPLGKNRGGPVRLVVPGWFGTNSTKWLCRLSLEKERSQSLYTTLWYNEVDPNYEDGRKRPVWMVEPNSIIVRPKQNAVVGKEVTVEGWAWSCDGVEGVEISHNDDCSSISAQVDSRLGFSWQRFHGKLKLSPGVTYQLIARAKCRNGTRQPLHGRRNHVHRVTVHVETD